ncbi:coronafacic acid synthetase [Pectobacterium actinidiae]|uniref:coronafacic acid synthetase n=1 Tax=Pectobacterium actinidiae TaxID=1507808 RepID=UPI0023AA4BFA|nr:coronafacic acid synthetase [Pectobacterium actinidiae]MDY4316516.1 coronafacic acid synthetase [Pectobacterium actinidiae]WEF13002.1 coronafacic acid synthetase [Pectobacterium actinidiae]GLW36141.1 coronafacic acid synthetase [Pectobacterium carotovorum subsp. carotovorum]
MTNVETLTMKSLNILGHGIASTPDLCTYKPAQKASLYADPLSWLVLEAVEQAINEYRDVITSACSSVGHIAISDQCTLKTIHDISETLSSGHLSPLRFSGACPGMIIGLPSQFLRFSGPSIVWSMPPDNMQPYATALAQLWLDEGSATHVIITDHRVDESGHHIRSVVVTQSGGEHQ